jgi:hypothetical protein
LVDGKLVIDSTPLNEAERYGDFLNHPKGHDEVWERLQRLGKVPADIPYEECPRGRVVFGTKSESFILYADKCILNRQDLIAQIEAALHLPLGKTKEDSDPHYCCFTCLYANEAHEDDWDF